MENSLQPYSVYLALKSVWNLLSKVFYFGRYSFDREYTTKPFAEKCYKIVSALLANHFIWKAVAFTQVIVHFSFMCAELPNSAKL